MRKKRGGTSGREVNRGKGNKMIGKGKENEVGLDRGENREEIEVDHGKRPGEIGKGQNQRGSLHGKEAEKGGKGRDRGGNLRAKRAEKKGTGRGKGTLGTENMTGKGQDNHFLRFALLFFFISSPFYL